MPVVRLLPPEDALNQLIVAPVEAVALKVMAVPGQPVAGVTLVIVGFTIVVVPVAIAEPDTDPVDTVILVDGIELTAMVCPATALAPMVGTTKK